MQTLSGKRVFISGGAGVIGSELVPLLFEAGCEILVGDLKPRPGAWPGGIRYRQGDLNEMSAGELQAFAPEIFIHLAATFERSTETYGFWEENFRHNVQLSHHLMTLHKDLPGLRRVVFASSYLIYDPGLYSFDAPQLQVRRLSEDDAIFPRNLIGMAKVAHEIELRFLGGFRKDRFTTIIARIYRGYGRGSNCVVSRWIRALLRGEAIQVYRPEGLFDYIYAGETALGLMKLIERPEVQGIINLGNGRARRVSELVEVLRRHFPSMVATTCDSDILFEASEANMDRFRAVTGWIPQRQLEDAIPLIIADERQHLDDAGAKRHGNVMISSAAKKVPLLQRVRQAAAKLHPEIGLIAADASDGALSRHFANTFWHMPLLSNLDAGSLMRACRDRGVTGIVPTRDGELPFFAEHREALAAGGIAVMVSAPQAVQTCLDKLEFAEHCARFGLPAIPTMVQLPSDATGTWVVKERHGAGSQRMGLNLDSVQARAHAQGLRHPVFQEYLGGFREFSADVYVDRQGRMKGCVVRSRDVIENGESQVTTTEDCPALVAMCERLVESLPFYGHIIIQAFVDEAGSVHLIECNPRFGGASSLSIEAGLDSFYWFLLEAQGADLGDYRFLYDPQRRLRQIRHAQDRIEVL